MARTFGVWSSDRRVLTIRDEPGALLSTALPPPDPNWRPPQHPFLSGSAQDANSEHALAELLAQATSFDDYLERLRGAGYRVEEER
jgi:hypothetical protein